MSDNTKKIESKGFCLYKDTLQTAFKILPTYEERGKLFTSILQYVNNETPEKFTDRIETCFLFLLNSIELSNEKYLKRKKTQKAYYDHIKQIRDKSKLSKEKKLNELNQYNNSINTIDVESKKENTKENNITSLSIERVKEILEGERIFFKKKSLEAFYSLNEKTYHWKLDPVSAARTYIEKHPDALTAVGEKKLPPVPAAPQTTPPALMKSKEHFADVFKECFGVQNFQVWFQKVEVSKFEESKNRFYFFVPSKFFAEYFRSNFEKKLLGTIKEQTKKKFSIFYEFWSEGQLCNLTPQKLSELQ